MLIQNEVYSVVKSSAFADVNKAEWLRTVGQTLELPFVVAAVVAWHEELGKDLVDGILSTKRAKELIEALDEAHLERGKITGTWRERQRDPQNADEIAYAEFDSVVWEICHKLQTPGSRETGEWCLEQIQAHLNVA